MHPTLSPSWLGEVWQVVEVALQRLDLRRRNGRDLVTHSSHRSELSCLGLVSGPQILCLEDQEAPQNHTHTHTHTHAGSGMDSIRGYRVRLVGAGAEDALLPRSAHATAINSCRPRAAGGLLMRAKITSDVGCTCIVAVWIVVSIFMAKSTG